MIILYFFYVILKQFTILEMCKSKEKRKIQTELLRAACDIYDS